MSEAPSGPAGASVELRPTPTPRAELLAAHRSVAEVGRYTVELMALGLYLRVTHLSTGRTVTVKRVGLRWLVWLDSGEMVKARSGELAEVFKSRVKRTRCAKLR